MIIFMLVLKRTTAVGWTMKTTKTGGHGASLLILVNGNIVTPNNMPCWLVGLTTAISFTGVDAVVRTIVVAFPLGSLDNKNAMMAV